MALKTYVSDGGFDLARLPIFFAIAIPAHVILALVYQVLDKYMPCVGIVTAVLLVGYAIISAATLGVATTAARNRNAVVHMVCGLFVTLLGYYVAWVTFFTLYFYDLPARPGMPTGIIWNPSDIAYGIAQLGKTGYRIIGSGSNVMPGELELVVWFIEAVVLVLAPPFLSVGSTREPFFPASNSWGTKRKLANTYESESAPKDAAGFLADEAFRWLRDFKPFVGVGALTLEWTEHSDEPLAYLTITRMVESVENKKKVLKPVPVVKFIELSQEQRRKIDHMLDEVGARTDTTEASRQNDEIEVTAGWDAAKRPGAGTGAGAGSSLFRGAGVDGAVKGGFDEAADSAYGRPDADADLARGAGNSAEVDPDAIAARHQSERAARAAEAQASADRDALAKLNSSAAPAAESAPPAPAVKPSLPPPRNPKSIADEWDT